MKKLIVMMLIMCFTTIVVASEPIKNGATDQSIYVVMKGTADGDPCYGLDTTLNLYYYEHGEAAPIGPTNMGQGTLAAHSDNTAMEVVDGASGVYQIDPPDIAFDGGIGKKVLFIITSDTSGVGIAFLEVTLSPPADIVAVNSQNDSAVNLDAFYDDGGQFANFDDEYDGTGYAGGTIVSQADITKVHGDALVEPNVAGYVPAQAEYIYGDTRPIGLANGANELQTDASGYMKVSDGTGTGQIDTDTGTVLLRSATETQIDNIESELAETDANIGAAGAGLTSVPWNANWDAEVRSEVDDSIEAYRLDHLVLNAETDDVNNDTIIARLVSQDSDWSTYVNGIANYALAAIGATVDYIHTDTGAMDTHSELYELVDPNHILYKLGYMWELEGGDYRFDANALATAPSGGATAEEVWEDPNAMPDSNYPTNFSSLSIDSNGIVDANVTASITQADINSIGEQVWKDPNSLAFTDFAAVTGTVATANSRKSFTLSSAAAAVAGAYKGMSLTITDADNGHEETQVIKNYTEGRIVTVYESYSFVPAESDAAVIWENAYFKPTKYKRGK